MPSQPPAERQPMVASTARRALHALVAAAGWALFAWWWWLVWRRASEAEIRYTLWFIGISTVLIVGSTALWALHNRSVFQSKRARLRVRPVTEDLSRDTLGRPVGLPEVPEECLRASVIVVRVEDGRKIYQPTVVREPEREAEEGQVLA